MTLIGKATLTLRNAKTGRIEFIESHKNTVTPAIARMLSSNLAGTLDYSKLLPLYSRLLGGVCAFNGSVDATDIFLPSAVDAALTAHAGQHGFSTNADTKRGSPNTQESFVFSNGVTWSWSWLQTNGNGRITDVVLTHADTGDYWNEDLENNTMDADFSPVERIDNKIITPSEFQYYRNNVDFPYVSNAEKIPLGFIGDTDHIVSVSQKENKKITIHIAKFTGKGIWLWNECGDIHDITKYDVTTAYNRNYVAFDKAGSMLYILSVGDTPTYKRSMEGKAINLANGTEISWSADCSSTLDSGSYKKCDGTALPSENVTVYCAGVGTYEPNFLKQLQVIDGSVFIPVYWVQSGIAPFPQGYTDCSIKIKLSDTSLQSIVKGFQDFNTAGYSDSSSQSQVNLGNGRVMNNEYMAWKNSSGVHIGQKIYCDRTDLFRSNIADVRQYCADQPTVNPVQYMTYVGENNSTCIRGCLLNKLYAATVFHLEESVTKNASQTMTIEYTLTEEEES